MSGLPGVDEAVVSSTSPTLTLPEKVCDLVLRFWWNIGRDDEGEGQEKVGVLLDQFRSRLLSVAASHMLTSTRALPVTAGLSSERRL